MGVKGPALTGVPAEDFGGTVALFRDVTGPKDWKWWGLRGTAPVG